MKDIEKKLKESSEIIRKVKTEDDVITASAELNKKLADCTSSEDLNAVADFVLEELEVLTQKTDDLLSAVTLQEQLAG